MGRFHEYSRRLFGHDAQGAEVPSASTQLQGASESIYLLSERGQGYRFQKERCLPQVLQENMGPKVWTLESAEACLKENQQEGTRVGEDKISKRVQLFNECFSNVASKTPREAALDQKV